MRIYTKQIDTASLTDFVTGAMGTSLSGQLNSYLNAGGYLGVNVVYTSGGSQIISGNKTFDASPNVPYSGGTGTAPSRLYVDNQIIANQASANTQVSGLVSGVSGFLINNLSAVSVTGSNIIQNPNFSGLGGTIVIRSGNFVLISGGAGGGGSSSNSDGINLSGNLNASGRRAWDDAINLSGRLAATGLLLSAVSVTGSSIINTPNFTGVGGTLVLQSGNFVLISGGGAGGGASTLSVTGSNPIASPNFTGINGVSVIQSGNIVAISGGGTTFVEINTFNITGTGNVTNNLTSSGSMYNTFNDYSSTTVTGNPTNISFFFDPVPTGLNLVETFVSDSFTFSGARFSCRQSGNAPVNGGILSGKLYQVDSNNTEQTLFNFTFNTGIVYSGSPVFLKVVTGNNRVGLSITNIMSGIEKFTIGVFGY